MGQGIATTTTSQVALLRLPASEKQSRGSRLGSGVRLLFEPPPSDDVSAAGKATSSAIVFKTQGVRRAFQQPSLSEAFIRRLSPT